MRISDLVGSTVHVAHRDFPGRLIACEVIGVDAEMRAIALARRDVELGDERASHPFWTTFENISEIRFEPRPETGA